MYDKNDPIIKIVKEVHLNVRSSKVFKADSKKYLKSFLTEDNAMELMHTLIGNIQLMEAVSQKKRRFRWSQKHTILLLNSRSIQEKLRHKLDKLLSSTL